MDEINSIFQQQGYIINSFIDYIDNKAYKLTDTKNPLKIGKLLSKIDPTLFSRYDTDTDKSKWKQILSNKDKALKIIISRHPYDLLGMSSGRDWRQSSCMRLGTSNDKVYKLLGFGEEEEKGQHKDKIKKDIEQGVLVAYVVNITDDNINKPLSRLLIKPYINEQDSKDILWVSADKLYGKQVDGFKSSVDEWLSSWQGDDFMGRYCIKSGLYSDGKENVRMEKPISRWTEKDRKRFLDKVVEGSWNINENGEVDVDGDVDIFQLNLTEIPVKFGSVGGSFDCSYNQLTSLEFAPKSVGRSFYCDNNQLTSLEFAPTSVGKGFYCNFNQLTSLEFAPTSVGRSFYCDNNQLTSLEFAPTSVGGDFYCDNNQLTSLEFAPTSVGGSFDCSDQKNGHKFTEEEVRVVCQVGGRIYV